MFSLIHAANLVLIAITAILIYKNRKIQNQKPIIALFFVIVCMFVISVIFFS